MPLYEFRCRACSHPFEDLVSASAQPSCPRCESEDLERLPSAFAVGRGAAGGALPLAAGGPCGSCGHPDGPGACKLAS